MIESAGDDIWGTNSDRFYYAYKSEAGKKAPIWLRLNYSNGVTTAYYGTNGTSWTQLSVSVPMSFSTYKAGLAAATRSTVPGTSVYSGLKNF